MKVKMKSRKELKKFQRCLPGQGDMDENSYFAIDMKNGELIEAKKDLNEVGSIIMKPVHWADHDQEFLVVEHPNPISRDEYERTKALYRAEERSMKGVC